MHRAFCYVGVAARTVTLPTTVAATAEQPPHKQQDRQQRTGYCWAGQHRVGQGTGQSTGQGTGQGRTGQGTAGQAESIVSSEQVSASLICCCYLL